ncbi:MAG: response regulator [Firmicutes bacterium]|nr:response regulator [Bacillota bacterium]
MSATVYVIDDEPAIRQIFSIALQRASFDVRSFNSGGHFVRQAPAEPDIMVLDLIMPGLNGDEVARICRVEWGWRRVRICVITGSLMLAREALTGVDAVLEKPVSIDHLITTVQQLALQPDGSPLDGAPGGSPRERAAASPPARPLERPPEPPEATAARPAQRPPERPPALPAVPHSPSRRRDAEALPPRDPESAHWSA